MRKKCEHLRTVPGYTITSEGDIPHRTVKLADGTTVVCPVIVERGKRGKLSRPVRTPSGRMLFALPGADVFAAPPAAA